MTPEQSQLLHAWRAAKSEVARANDLLKALDAMVKETFTDNGVYETSDGTSALKITSYSQHRLNTTKLKADLPGVYDAYADEVIEIWVAQGLTQRGRKLDEEEFLDVELVSVGALGEWCRQGQLPDAKSVTCLWWLEQWCAGKLALNWVDGQTG